MLYTVLKKMTGLFDFSGKEALIEKDAEQLFSVSTRPVPRRARRTVKEEKQEQSMEKSEEPGEDGSQDESKEDSSEDESQDEDQEASENAPAEQPASKKRRRRNDDDDDLEDRYMQKLAEEDKKETEKRGTNSQVQPVGKDDDAQDEDDKDKESDVKDEDEERPVHESLLKKTEEIEKAEATIFVGNVVIAAVTDKKVHREFESLFKKHGKVRSVRFRSIAFSTPLPRKAAIAQKEFHANRETVNAYVVFKDKASVKGALTLNGSVFKDHHLRVDSVAHPAPQDNKRSVFVGNLDFEAEEEPLWVHFGSCGDVESVRIVRDAKTNVGKGFAYVQFKEAVSVEKALLLNGKELKVGSQKKGRQLRITRARKMRAPKQRESAEPAAKRARLSADDKAKLGRAKSMLGKAGRSEVDKVVEGQRAKPGDVVPGLKKKGNKARKPRIGRARSAAHKKGASKK